MGGAAGYDVFLSYRRERSAEAARLLQYALQAKGYSVFLDIKDLGAGYFDETLLEVIGKAANFIVLLAPGSLDRCANEDDWLRREIEHAIDLGRNVVPVMMEGFRFPPAGELPDTLAALPRRNAVSYNHEYFDAVVERLAGFLAAAPAVPETAQPVGEPIRPVARTFIVFVTPGGVLHTPSSSPVELDPEPVARFAGFLRRHPGATVVLASSPGLSTGVDPRRLFPEDLRERIAGVTSDAFGRMGVHRSAEIHAFLRKHPNLPACWVAIDHDASRYQPDEPVVVVHGGRGFDRVAEEELERLLTSVLAKDAADGVAVRDHPLAVDCTAIHPDLFRVFTDWPENFQLLVDSLWLDSLSKSVPTLSYGRSWTLCPPGSDAPIAKIGDCDVRTLEEVGIERGSVLRARYLRP